ncbi:hypothetical protein DPMN_128632 [Dreissena polymorpha]|uniref:Uncharacterized protein n=1 Tax=Dreissena polymorpha TaxID=45954 RepID=A0A9D4H1L9_DREPO|nr:hypothetical protein DPMN_128564 [Dreissena polymorpha]KAH3826722.1 hypothetical protein DPMN_128632 [Dreissena polymorpha]
MDLISERGPILFLPPGEDLWVLAIGSSFSNIDLRPHVKYIGNMHGNEVFMRPRSSDLSK